MKLQVPWARAAITIAAAIALTAPISQAEYGKGGKHQRVRQENVRPDNTEVNKRDTSDKAVTPMDQSNDSRKLEVTRQIREAVEKDDTLSTYAHNIKIITTDDGVIHLRGPVNSADEKKKIEKHAQEFRNGLTVKNELEVTGDAVSSKAKR